MNKILKNKKISVIGLGYIVLQTAALLASNEYSVSGYDINDATINAIKSGKTNIKEPEINYYLKEALKSGKLLVKNTIQPGDIYIICVPTPVDFLRGSPRPNIEKYFLC